MDLITFSPIGVIHSEHEEEKKTPIQPIYAKECLGKAEVFENFAEGLKDIEAFSHFYLIYLLHKVKETKLTVKPFLQDKEHGIFATRAPFRPNPLGMSIVELTKRENNVLFFKGCDILNGSPIIDIKPYTERFDYIKTKSNGWQDNVLEEDAQIRGLREFKA